MPVVRGSDGGNSRPRSPWPMAFSTAVASAWSTTSPSEWPYSRGASSMSGPPSQQAHLGAKAGERPGPGRTAQPRRRVNRRQGAHDLQVGGLRDLHVGRLAGHGWRPRCLRLSKSAASSLNEWRPRRVEGTTSRSRRAPCGVWVRTRPRRSTDASIRPPAARLSESTTGTAGTAAPCSRAAAATRSASAGDASGPCGVVDRARPAAAASATPARTESERSSPPATIVASRSQATPRKSRTWSRLATTITRPTERAAAIAATDHASSERPVDLLGELVASAHPRAAAGGDDDCVGEGLGAGDRISHAAGRRPSGRRRSAARERLSPRSRLSSSAPPPSTTIIVPSSR